MKQLPDEIHLSITRRHIEHGHRYSCCSCPIALALKAWLGRRKIKSTASVFNTYACFSISDDRSGYVNYNMPEVGKKFIVDFDSDAPVINPIKFTLTKRS